MVQPLEKKTQSRLAVNGDSKLPGPGKINKSGMGGSMTKVMKQVEITLIGWRVASSTVRMQLKSAS
jgi:hypothetical protein